MTTKAIVKDEEVKEIAGRISKGDLFVEALFRNNFNRTKAALEAFDIKDDNPNTAGVIGWEYLRKPKIQEKISARLATQDMTPEWLINKIKEGVENNEGFAQVPFIDRLGVVMGVNVKPDSPNATGGRGAPVAVQINLNAPAGDELPTIDSKDVIDVKQPEASK